MEFQIPTTGWIWGNGWQESAGNKTQLAYFRKIVSVKEIPDERKIQISADSRYKLYINDRLVCVGPSKGDRMVWYFDEVDAAPYLAAGENVIAVEVLRYPPVHKKGSHSVFRTDIPGLFVKELHAETEEAFGFSTDASWKCKLEEHYEIVPESFLFSPLFIFESRCGIPENAGWKSIEYIADAWENAVEYNILQMDKAVSPYNLLPRTIPHMKLEKRKFAGLFGYFQSSSEKKIWNNMLAGKSRVCIPANSHETVEISAGELTTGYLSLRMQGGSGSTVKLLTSESYVSKDSPTKGFNRNLEERGLVGKVGGLNVFDRYWSFIDWTSQWDDTTGMPKAGLSGPITMESLLYIMGLDSAAAVMDYLDRNGMAEEYRTRANTVREAVNRYCVDENGMYTDGPGVPEYSQHCQVFAILTDTVDIVKGKAFLEKTLDAPEEYAQCSVAMAYYLFRAMEKAGLYARTDRQWNLWRDMIKKNLTTCVEDNVNERSDCHAWGALALYELPAVVLGVKPAAPGFKKVSVNPNPGYMTWAKGDVATKFGMVHVEWEKEENGEIEVSYQVPDGMEVVK